MIEDDEEHGARAEEDGELVEVVVGYHVCGLVIVFFFSRNRGVKAPPGEVDRVDRGVNGWTLMYSSR